MNTQENIGPTSAPLYPALPLLDHGHIRLIDHMGNDLSIVRNARNSHDAAWRTGMNKGSDFRLINYLWKHKHTTPFEAVIFTIEVKAPILVFRQWHRHRTQAYNEVSARYTELPEEFYVPSLEVIGVQDPKNRQGRVLGSGVDFDRVQQRSRYDIRCREAFQEYKSLLECGWPRELARGVLPLATYSKMFATMSLLNLFRFATLRSDPHAQYEIRVYSDALLGMVREIVPVAVLAYEGSETWYRKAIELMEANIMKELDT